MIECYKDQFEPCELSCDLVLEGISTQMENESITLRQALAPIGRDCYTYAHSNLMTLDRINLVEGVLYRIMS